MRFSVYQRPVLLLFVGASFAALPSHTGASTTEDELVVHLNTGSLQGGSQKSIFGLNLEYFLGIPYAAAPVGDHRFSPPQPAQSWEGVRDGTNYGARCPQNEDSFPRNITVGMFKAFSSGPAHTSPKKFLKRRFISTLGPPSARSKQQDSQNGWKSSLSVDGKHLMRFHSWISE